MNNIYEEGMDGTIGKWDVGNEETEKRKR